MELVQLVVVYRLHDPDDVLHRCVWLDARLHGEDGHRRVRRSKLEGVAGVFSAMLGSPTEMLGWMLAVIVIGFLVCSLGLQKGVERITKIMMICLLFVMVALVFRSVDAARAGAGLEFYLIPDFEKMFGGGIGHFGEVVYAAMGQAFFTLSIGIGACASSAVTLAKTVSARRGLPDYRHGLYGGAAFRFYHFPACFTFGVEPQPVPR